MGKSIGENISKTLSNKFIPGMLATCQKLLDHTKQSATDALKITSKKSNSKTPEATGDLIGNKIGSKIRKISRSLPRNTSEAAKSEKEIPKERYISPEKRHKIIDDLRLIQ